MAVRLLIDGLFYTASSLVSTAAARTVGAPGDEPVRRVAELCGQSNPDTFKFGNCPDFIDCMFENLAAGASSGFQSGGNIAALVPTILALIGSPPLELVQLALIAPHRAFAACLFGVGLPSGLFRQLRPRFSELADRDEKHPQLRIWVIPVAGLKQTQLRKVATRLVADLVILGLAGIMLWRNWAVGAQTMVTWRPFACAIWMFLAILILWAFTRSFEVVYTEDETGASSRGILDLLALPYRQPQARRKDPLDTEAALKRNDTKSTTATPAPESSQPAATDRVVQRKSVKSSSPHKAQDTHTTTAIQSTSVHPQPTSNDSGRHGHGPAFEVRITMASVYGLRSWRWFEAIIETLAVGVYLYATFVLASVVFLSGNQGITYAVVMVLSLSGTRLVDAIA